MANFIQPAFIHKNTLYLRKKLEELGYCEWQYENPILEIQKNYPQDCLYIARGYYSVLPFEGDKEIENIIDCGINEDLFLSIAALRDDTDKYQWFVLEANYAQLDGVIIHPKGFLIRCMSDHWNEGDTYMYSNSTIPAHKATVEELIEHFKKE